MTEKRFKMNVIEEELYPMPVYYDNGREMMDNEIVDLLNNLSDENDQLKKDIEYYKIERKALFEYIDKKDDLKLELKVEK